MSSSGTGSGKVQGEENIIGLEEAVRIWRNRPRSSKFYALNDNDYFFDGTPVLVYSGRDSENKKIKLFSSEASRYILEQIMNDNFPVTESMLKKANHYGIKNVKNKEIVKLDYETLNDKTQKSIAAVEKLFGPLEEDPGLKKQETVESSSVQNEQENKIIYEEQTAKQISEDRPSVELSIPDTSDAIISIQRSIKILDGIITKEANSEVLDNEEELFREKTTDPVKLRLALKSKLQNYTEGKIQKELDLIVLSNENATEVIRDIEDIRRRKKRTDITNFKNLLTDLRNARVPVIGTLKDVMMDIAPQEIQGVEGDLLQILDAPIGEPPPLEDVNPVEPAQGLGQDPGDQPNVPSGPDMPDKTDEKAEPSPDNGVPDSVPLGVVIPNLWAPKYHLDSIEEYFGSKTRPDWDTDLMKSIMGHKWSKTEILVQINGIITKYDVDLGVYKAKSDGDIHEYHELRQLWSCLKRGMQKGTRSRQAVVKLSDIVGIARTPSSAPGTAPVDPSKVEGLLSGTTNAPGNLNVPFYAKVEKPIPDSQKGIYINPQVQRPKTYVQVFY